MHVKSLEEGNEFFFFYKFLSVKRVVTISIFSDVGSDLVDAATTVYAV